MQFLLYDLYFQVHQRHPQTLLAEFSLIFYICACSSVICIFMTSSPATPSVFPTAPRTLSSWIFFCFWPFSCWQVAEHSIQMLIRINQQPWTLAMRRDMRWGWKQSHVITTVRKEGMSSYWSRTVLAWARNLINASGSYNVIASISRP